MADPMKISVVRGKLKYGVPFLPKYGKAASAHYGLIINIPGDDEYQIVINVGRDNLIAIDKNFNHPILKELEQLPLGITKLSEEGMFYPSPLGIKGIDYIRDENLFRSFKDNYIAPSVYYGKTEKEIIQENNKTMVEILNLSNISEKYNYRRGPGTKSQQRDAYRPKDDVEIEIFAFGDEFDRGMHNIHMNQGNPRGEHSVDNGIWQDGVVIVKVNDKFYAYMSAFFETQQLPTIDSGEYTGWPVGKAQSLLDFFRKPITPLENPKGISLHIGLNEVDPSHYDGWTGELLACEFDARDMEKIASSLGYISNTLFTKNATREAVKEKILEAADQLQEGDIFFLTYSGHGGQVPDMDSDEDDKMDETWCLFDGELLDDELYEFWTKFKANVRIVVLSDSCHSGTMVRSISTSQRGMPPSIAQKVYLSNIQFYKEIDNLLPREKKELLCTVKLISGCMDNQTSLDGEKNGLFTETLLQVWNSGKFSGNYIEFHKKVLKKMPNTQSPNLVTIGKSNSSFDNQKPFEI